MRYAVATALLATGTALPAHAAMIEASVTADNHYALYTDFGGSLSLVGGNELGAGGAPGTYNWSLPEHHSFAVDTHVYIVAWSDDRVAQGLLASLTVDGEPLFSGDPAWEVYATDKDLDNGDAYPTAAAIEADLLAAVWEDVAVGGRNGDSPAPWGTVAGVSDDARWMWRTPVTGGDPFHGGADHGEYLIFRIPVPTPGVMTLAGLAGLGAIPRRRRDHRDR